MKDVLKHVNELIAENKSLKEALAQRTEQEPVACDCNQGQVCHICDPITHPPQRTWVGLTDEELHQICNSLDYYGDMGLVQLIEAKLKEKNT
jgi:hypothetical protein